MKYKFYFLILLLFCANIILKNFKEVVPMNLTYLKSNLLIVLKSKKNQLLIVILVLFSTFSLFIVENQKIGDGIKSWETYSESLQANSNYFDNEMLKKTTYKNTYDNLNKQAQELASLQNSQVFTDPVQYLNSYRNLLTTMQAGYTNHYAGANTLNVPSQFFISKELNRINYLINHKIPIVMNNESSATYLIYVLSFLGTIIFFYISFISADSWIINLKHQSVLKNIPYFFKDEIIGKIGINFILVFSSVLLSIIGAYVFAGIKHNFVTLNYPVNFYFTHALTIPLWSYCLVFLAYISGLVIFVTSLSMFLNQITKNIYLTIFIEGSIYALLFLPKDILKWLVFLPSPYLDLTNLFNGDLASNLHLTNVNFLTGYLVLLIWSLILIYGFKYLGERKG